MGPKSYRVQNRVMVHPFFMLAKLAPNLLQLIGFAEAYGWNRVYRRLCEGTKLINGMTRPQQAQIRMMLKESLRFPVRSYDLLRNHEMVSFASQYATCIAEEKNLISWRKARPKSRDESRR